MECPELDRLFDKWTEILRLKNQWDLQLRRMDSDDFRKTGDIKIDCDDKKAILMLNVRNPKQENFEKVIVHELLHLKLYPLDQLTENLIDAHYENPSPAREAQYSNFMVSLEITVEELAKCFL